jgi:hypothetical protein
LTVAFKRVGNLISGNEEKKVSKRAVLTVRKEGRVRRHDLLGGMVKTVGLDCALIYRRTT